MLLKIKDSIFDEDLPCVSICVFTERQFYDYKNNFSKHPKKIFFGGLKITEKTVFLKITEKSLLTKGKNDVTNENYYKVFSEGKIFWIDENYFSKS